MPSCIESAIAANRAAGSGSSVARLAMITPTALPDEVSNPSPRNDTGTIAVSEASGNAFRSSR